LIDSQTQEWESLYNALCVVMSVRGVADYLGDGDYWILDDNYGFFGHKIYIWKIHILIPDLICEIKTILGKYDKQWVVTINLDVPGTEKTMPPMGLKITALSVTDELVREFLPEPLKLAKFV
jgi:hypothetical protein